MRRTVAALVSGAAFAAANSLVHAEPVKIGMMLTLSGPPAALGNHIRDGFNLALKEQGGKLGGQETEVIVVDDELKPDTAVDKARALVERDGIDIFVGVVFSNVMMAVLKPLTDAEVVIVSPNAGPAPIAGEACSPYYFNVAWQNDNNHEVMGQYATDKGFETAVVMVPNYQAGKDSVAGFKRFYKGEVVEEIYTQLGQLDFSAELARIAAATPAAVFTFMPGGMGVNLVKQYEQAGLADTIPFLSAFTVDETTLPGTQDAALGMFSGSQWARNLDNGKNREFVARFEAEYGYAPSLYASQGYDAANLIHSAIAVAGGADDRQMLIQGLKNAEFQSVRGDFRFNTNQFPIQDFYLVEAVKRGDAYVTEQVTRVFDDHADAYAANCNMN